ncbi:hypothetical protein D3Z60_08670 [Lachnospiraceae bacterium]|jgi:hypothetical protein|nr:hypothetical protein [Lachnospiraceae bacterium]
MGVKYQLKKYENWIIALAALAALVLFTGFKFDYFYDLNDDVLMKDILAGVYTGTPEGHNIQMLWPVSAFISLFYRAAGDIPWYGLFLCICHYGMFFLIVKRSLGFAATLPGKLLAVFVESMLFTGLFLEHLVFAQYTVTCTLLGAGAAFWFYTTDMELGPKKFILKNIPAVMLVSAAYLVRSEMLLLVLPMICVAGAAKWGSEEKIFTKEHAFKYLTVIGLILAGILAGQAAHEIAYSSKEWRTFTEFFNNRTELYDFQAPPEFGAHQAFYESIGLSEQEKILLDNYNFGMDEEIDEVMVGEIAEYAGRNKSAETPFTEKLSGVLGAYLYRFLHGQGAVGSDYPWNYAVILGYVGVLGLAVPRKYAGNKIQQEGKVTYFKNILGAVWKLAFLFLVRTLLWMYILMRERAPERITHSLYLMELCILGAMLLVHWQRICCRKVKNAWALALAAGFGLLALNTLPEGMEMVSARQKEREAVNGLYRELYDRLSSEENAGNFYLIDVYSSVAHDSVPYSEKMFADVDNSLDNYDIMGGWACKSPLQRKKLAAFGIENMEQALRDKENVYFVRKNTEDMQWLAAYYEDHGTPVKVSLADTVADVFEIYRVEAAEKGGDIGALKDGNGAKEDQQWE